mmetsp:Transcript_9531/g.31589  ORF Transcript_9531/g.31589 Transcript_9531/m.31589 type:complete len:256 (+) Transcript_9531:2073-2840(+)
MATCRSLSLYDMSSTVCARATFRSRSAYGLIRVASSHAVTAKAYTSAAYVETRRIKTSGGMYGSVPTMCCFWNPPDGLPPPPVVPIFAINRPATVLPSASSSEYTMFCSELVKLSCDSATPKSHTFASKFPSSKMLLGLTSLCTYPRWCTYSSADAVWSSNKSSAHQFGRHPYECTKSCAEPLSWNGKIKKYSGGCACAASSWRMLSCCKSSISVSSTWYRSMLSFVGSFGFFTATAIPRKRPENTALAGPSWIF